ncbi:MAG: capsid cement protein [Bryobacteraceae bacterium]
MKNFVQEGCSLTVTAPAGGVVSGQILMAGAIVGVAAFDAAVGAQVEVKVEGVYDLAKATADLLTAGAVAKLNAGNLVAVAGTAKIGWIVADAPAGTATARVKLTPGIAG